MEVKQKSGKRKRGTSFGDKNTRTERGLVRSNFLEYLRHCIIYRLVYQLCETGGKGISDLASLEAEAHETNTPELPFVFGPCSTPRRHCRPLQNGENNLIDSQVHANSCILANKCRSLFLRRDPLPLELIKARIRFKDALFLEKLIWMMILRDIVINMANSRSIDRFSTIQMK